MDKAKIVAELAEVGKVVITIRKTSICIEVRNDRYEISVLETGLAPRKWLYRTKRVAIDRFEEQVLHYRRIKCQ
jgi:hypothetical protein